MRVLLSAYACEPNKGSEQEVGWQRALHMRPFADEVWVLTRANNQPVIEADPLSHDPGLHFIYYDLPGWALRLKKKPWFLYFYFTFWQWGAYRAAARQHRKTPFDRVYHVTFVSVLAGSLMGRLGIPFVIGPIAGGERAPLRLRRSMTLRGKASEFIRDMGIFVQRCSPVTRSAFAAAESIYVATQESLQLVAPKWRAKTRVLLAVALPEGAAETIQRPRPVAPRFVFIGRLLHWKAVHLAIRALAEASGAVPGATLTLFGQGPDELGLRRLAKQLGVADAVEFAGQVPRQQVTDSLAGFTALVFPSLHDSGGMAVLEALSAGLPVISLDLGGPGIIMNETCGIVVSTAHADEAQTVTGLANAMISMATMANTDWERLSTGAVDRSNELSWDKLTKRIVEQGGPA